MQRVLEMLTRESDETRSPEDDLLECFITQTNKSFELRISGCTSMEEFPLLHLSPKQQVALCSKMNPRIL